MLLCSRQTGKSITAAATALRVAMLEAPALILVLSPSERQSGELMNKIKGFYAALLRGKARSLAGLVRPHKVVHDEGAVLEAAWAALPEKERESSLQLHFKNGSRIIALPASANTVVGYSGVALLIIDEASRVHDDLYRAVRPMMAVSKGRMLALSTPFGKRGFFFEEWEGPAKWLRVRITAEQCPRIAPEFLLEERAALGERWYRQEYGCSFEEAIDAVFSHADIQAALTAETPWNLGE